MTNFPLGYLAILSGFLVACDVETPPVQDVTDDLGEAALATSCTTWSESPGAPYEGGPYPAPASETADAGEAQYDTSECSTYSVEFTGAEDAYVGFDLELDEEVCETAHVEWKYQYRLTGNSTWSAEMTGVSYGTWDCQLVVGCSCVAGRTLLRGIDTADIFIEARAWNPVGGGFRKKLDVTFVAL